MIQPLLERILGPGGLSGPSARALVDCLVAPSTTDAERTALLVGVAARPASVAFLVAAAREMRRRAVRFDLPRADRPLDLCGSGGAPRPSFNVSTVSALVVAAAGVPVVKHGNRSHRGICGSSDLLEALGLPVTTSVVFGRTTYAAERVAFLHAPLYHPAIAAVRTARQIVGIPTLFNRLGPLANPAKVDRQVVGAQSTELARLYAAVLPQLGVRRGIAMSSEDGCDEFSPRAPTTAIVWGGGRRAVRTVRPSSCLASAERRGSWGALPPRFAAQEAERILAGASGARRGSVLLTAGAAFWLAGRSDSIPAGVRSARGILDSGRAASLLERLRDLARATRTEER